MHCNSLMRFAARAALALAVLFLSFGIAGAQQQGAAQQPEAARGQPAEAQRQTTQPLNNAPVWRDIRSGDINKYQTTQVRGVETNVLIQTEGEIWRRIRNGPITVYGGWLLVLVVVAIGLFFWRRGKVELHDPKTGRQIVRFNAWERTIHWAVAISFVILAISGLLLLFGKYVVLPVFGYTLFSMLAIVCKNLHNFVGPLFVICTVLMFATYVKDNLPQRGDGLWLRRAGGMFSGEHVPSWKFNAGEKIWFWFGLTVLGLAVSVTGFILDFPNFDQGRSVMQQTTVIHAIAALFYIAMSFGHMYLGTIGLEGSYDAMRHGTVDETWAKEHHEYWYHEEMAKRGRVSGGTAHAVPASPIKEGWKL